MGAQEIETVTKSKHIEADHKSDDPEKKALDRKLDEALEETFPGSDPVALSQPTPGPADKKP